MSEQRCEAEARVRELEEAASAFLDAVIRATPGYAEGTPTLTPYDNEGERLARILAGLPAATPPSKVRRD